MSDQTTEATRLLAAGALLPIDTAPDTAPGTDQAVRLSARTYRHPVLDDRVVVRLADDVLGDAEDTVVKFFGVSRVDEPVPVAWGARPPVTFPESLVVQYPDDAHHALALVPEMERIAERAKSAPRAALNAYHKLAERLVGTVPHFLPTLYEQAGRVFLAAEQKTLATQMFSRARKAEAEYGLEVDADRLDAVYREFVEAGGLNAGAIAEYAKSLADRFPPVEALDRFRQLCVRAVQGGVEPSVQLATAMRRLLQAATKAGHAAAADEQERAYLREVLQVPKIAEAPVGWWKAHRPTLVALCQQDPTLRGALLNPLPSDTNQDLLRHWLDLLTATDAVAGLVDHELPASQRPPDGSAGWLMRFLRTWRESCRWTWRGKHRIPPLYALVERMGDALRAELTASGAAIDPDDDIDLIDLLLSMDVPVQRTARVLDLDNWVDGTGQRDLRALASDPWYRDALLATLDDSPDVKAMQRLVDTPGGRDVMAEWVRRCVHALLTAGLPRLEAAVERLTRLPNEILALAATELAAVDATTLAAALARTLRGGVVDELGWPAWEEAVADVVDTRTRARLIAVDAWPCLIVASPLRVRVIDADGIVLRHDTRVPANDVAGEPGFHYVDGDLLVYWESHDRGYGRLRGYWHSSADAPQALGGKRRYYQPRTGAISLPLPGGGRTTGAGVLHAGDSAVPDEMEVISDGTSYWALIGRTWHKYAPATGTYGPEGVPEFFATHLRAAPWGSTLHASASWLRPVATHRDSPCGVAVGGLLGWCVVTLPNGEHRGTDLAGRTITVRNGVPAGALTLPGDDRPRALLADGAIVDPDGVVVADFSDDDKMRDFAAGSLALPPIPYWHNLRPRDPEGSAALRQATTDVAAALLEAAADPDDLPTQIRSVLPQITHDALVAGVAGVVQFAAARRKTVDTLVQRIAALHAGDEDVMTGPADQELDVALSGIRGQDRAYWRESHHVFELLHMVDRARHAGDDAVALHFDGPELPDVPGDWWNLAERCDAVAVRAALPTTPPDQREALHAFLTALDRLDLTSAAQASQWRRVVLHLDDRYRKKPDGTYYSSYTRHLMPLGGGKFLVVLESEMDEGVELTALYHDPTGEFATPAPYTLRSSAPVGPPRPAGWLAAFLAEYQARGPAPWFSEAVDEFARLARIGPAVAGMVLAGMPMVDSAWPLPADQRKLLGLKAADASYAQATLRQISVDVRRAVVAALLPDDPMQLWTDGPDVAAAAEVWTEIVGPGPAVPEPLLVEASSTLRALPCDVNDTMAALAEPDDAPTLHRDLAWTADDDYFVPVDDSIEGFTSDVLVSTVSAAAWTAHQVPAGHPLRTTLPVALDAIRSRLANPELILVLDNAIFREEFQKVAGQPSETGDGWVRYGAVVLATGYSWVRPGLRVALLDEHANDPYLAALSGSARRPYAVVTALRTACDPRFAALLADPGDPVAGTRDADGTWWPQDPTRSVPDLVAEVAAHVDLPADAAALYLMVLAMPDPTDRNVARWTGWKPARLKAAQAALAATDLVVQAKRNRAGRSLFLPGLWLTPRGHQPIEQWKVPLFGLTDAGEPPLAATVPLEPAADLYRRAWRRLQAGDRPGFTDSQLQTSDQRR